MARALVTAVCLVPVSTAFFKTAEKGHRRAAFKNRFMADPEKVGLPRRHGRPGGVGLWQRDKVAAPGREAAADTAVGVGAEVKKEFLTIV